MRIWHVRPVHPSGVWRITDVTYCSRLLVNVVATNEECELEKLCEVTCALSSAWLRIDQPKRARQKNTQQTRRKNKTILTGKDPDTKTSAAKNQNQYERRHEQRQKPRQKHRHQHRPTTTAGRTHAKQHTQKQNKTKLLAKRS